MTVLFLILHRRLKGAITTLFTLATIFLRSEELHGRIQFANALDASREREYRLPSLVGSWPSAQTARLNTPSISPTKPSVVRPVILTPSLQDFLALFN
jgi:hypothetical protein